MELAGRETGGFLDQQQQFSGRGVDEVRSAYERVEQHDAVVQVLEDERLTGRNAPTRPAGISDGTQAGLASTKKRGHAALSRSVTRDYPSLAFHEPMTDAQHVCVAGWMSAAALGSRAAIVPSRST